MFSKSLPFAQLPERWAQLGIDFLVVEPSQSLAFPMNVIAPLPYLVMNYEDGNELCITSADNIARVSTEKIKKLENLSSVMTLYSRRTFATKPFSGPNVW